MSGEAVEFASQFYDPQDLSAGSAGQFHDDGGVNHDNLFQPPDEPDSSGVVRPGSNGPGDVFMGGEARRQHDDDLGPGFAPPEEPPSVTRSEGSRDTGTVPQDLLAQAFQRGITADRALAMGEDGLRDMLQIIDSNLIGAGVNLQPNGQAGNFQPPAGTNGHQQQPPNGQQQEELNYEIPKFEKFEFQLPEDADPDDPAWKALSGLGEQVNRFIEPIINRLMLTEQAILERDIEDTQRTFNTGIGKLGEEWSPIFGKGEFSALPPNSPERANWQRAYEFWRDVIQPRYPSHGYDQQIAMAVNAVFPTHAARAAVNGERSKILDHGRTARGMTSRRPTQRRVSAEDAGKRPVDRAAQRAAEYLDKISVGGRFVDQL